MSDPFDAPPKPPGADRGTVERVRARTSVTSPRIQQPSVPPAAADDDDSIFGSTLSGKTPVAQRAAPAAPAARAPERTDPRMSVPSSRPPTSSSGPAEATDPFGQRPVASRNRSGMTVVRASELAAVAPPAPALAPSMLPPRRVSTTPGPPPPGPPPPPLVDLNAILSPGTPPPPLLMDLDDLLGPSPSPPGGGTRPAPARPAIEPGPPPPARRPSGLMSLDPPVEPSTPTRRPTGLMSLDPEVEPSNPSRRPGNTGTFGRPPDPPPTRVVSKPGIEAATPSVPPPPMAPRGPLPTGLREDGTALSAAEAALPGLFKTPEQVQRRRIQIAASGVALIALGVVTVFMWIANRPPPPRTGSAVFAVADKATVTGQHVAGLARLKSPEVEIVVGRVVGTVARAMLRDAPQPEVIITTDAGALAYPTPDGRLVLSTGMLRTLASQAELAALAAHLLAHQTHFHLDDAIDAEAKTLGPDVRVAVSSNMATPGGVRVATVGLWHTFTEAQEVEADAAAVIALKRATWEATALRTLWQRLDSLTPKPALAARHPLTPARVTALEAAEQVRLPGSDLVRGDAGRSNSAEYQAQVKDVLDPPVIVVEKAREATPSSSSEPVTTRITTEVAAPKTAPPPKKPVPEPTPAPTPASPRDQND